MTSTVPAWVARTLAGEDPPPRPRPKTVARERHEEACGVTELRRRALLMVRQVNQETGEPAELGVLADRLGIDKSNLRRVQLLPLVESGRLIKTEAGYFHAGWYRKVRDEGR